LIGLPKVRNRRNRVDPGLNVKVGFPPGSADPGAFRKVAFGGMKSGSHREGGAAVVGLESGHWPLMN
jgi:hypothetical protein